MDLEGKFVLPGFIDGHTHFEGTGAQLMDANLLAVSDEEGLRKEIARVVQILGEGEWITRGLWGAYEQWALGASEAGSGTWPIPLPWNCPEWSTCTPRIWSGMTIVDRKIVYERVFEGYSSY